MRYLYNRKGPFKFENITIVTIHGGLVLIVIIQSKPQGWVIDIDFIIGYYTVKIERVSDRYWFYYNLCEIEQQKLYHLLLYIKCVSVVWDHIVSDHGATTALNKETFGIFLFLIVYNNSMSYCSWKSYTFYRLGTLCVSSSTWSLYQD